MIGWQSVAVNPPIKWDYYLVKDNKGSLMRALFNPGFLKGSSWFKPRVGKENKHTWYVEYDPVDVKMWASLNTDKGEQVQARRTRKNNSYFNVVKENK